jgi:hypothetical protein
VPNARRRVRRSGSIDRTTSRSMPVSLPSPVSRASAAPATAPSPREPTPPSTPKAPTGETTLAWPTPQWDLHAKGHQLSLEPKARTFDTNFSTLRSWTAANFDSGRVFAAARASDWSPPRRLVFAGSSPLIPAVRLMRILPVLARSGPRRAERCRGRCRRSCWVCRSTRWARWYAMRCAREDSCTNWDTLQVPPRAALGPLR